LVKHRQEAWLCSHQVRDDFTDLTKRNLAQQVACRCSKPDCRAVTAGPHTNDAKALNVGVAAHITAASPDGPRFDPTLSVDERKAPANAIWLCQTCAKLVDNDPERFTSVVLREWKRLAFERAVFEVAKTDESFASHRSEIWDLFKRYAPEATAEVLFREGYDALSAADPSLKYAVSVDGRVVKMTAERRDGEPVSVSINPTFPDTELGRQKAEDFRRFLDEGTEVELDHTCVSIDDLPDPIRRAARYRTGQFTLRLGPRRPRRLAIALIIRNEAGEVYEFPYIDLATNHFEGEVVVLTNEQQPIPFRFEERLFPDRRAETNWTFLHEGRTFWWLREFLRLRAVLSKPSVTILRDLEDGIEHVAVVTEASIVDIPYDLSIVERVVAVQARVKVAIRMPKREFFTDEDINRLERIEHVLKTGSPSKAFDGVSITIQGSSAGALLRDFQTGNRPMAQTIPEHFESLLDNQIPLGPVELFCARMRVSSDDATRLGNYLASGSSASISLNFVPVEGEVIHARYSRWVDATSTPPTHEASEMTAEATSQENRPQSVSGSGQTTS